MFRFSLASRILGQQNTKLFDVRKCTFSELKEKKDMINSFQEYKPIDKQKTVVVEEKESFLEDVQEFRDKVSLRLLFAFNSKIILKKRQRIKEWKVAFIIAFMYINLFYCKEVLLFPFLKNKPWSY
ncbi:transmembrane protein, putative (macronuclear) [Tetrahymena thermophila SB210]|uniref:Transmembrane protein, putative n=1 Tax=Tetrahymena thermophila (strain SB210) TaxID=312017 RepID=W7X4T5_TETTS|nr:transmembrane protein, putative [Tetrahymena thermophila SB210]EWS72432.1 transmembrane protein, putative [Tetrahymena thermophila SB210]|eukprot:XP_012655034.1 transmembrane protein, putative [Tetrahymena thermophila SB210]